MVFCIRDISCIHICSFSTSASHSIDGSRCLHGQIEGRKLARLSDRKGKSKVECILTYPTECSRERSLARFLKSIVSHQKCVRKFPNDCGYLV